MTPTTIAARLTYARHSLADGHSPLVALLDLSNTLKGNRTMTQHTPGPWENESKVGDLAKWLYVSNHEGRRICRVAGYGKRPRYRSKATDEILNEEDAANARLIAAAPDLLAACRLMLDAVNEHHKDGAILWVSPGETAWELLTDVIAKATGTNPANIP